jgi:hypothetical protein
LILLCFFSGLFSEMLHPHGNQPELSVDMKTYVSFTPNLPHENLDEPHTQSSSPMTWKLTST